MNGAYRIRLSGNFAYVSAVLRGHGAAIDISDPRTRASAGSLTDTPSA